MRAFALFVKNFLWGLLFFAMIGDFFLKVLKNTGKNTNKAGHVPIITLFEKLNVRIRGQLLY